jgi:hypothetical protein
MAGPDDEYTIIPTTRIAVRDATDGFSPKLKKLLIDDDLVRKLSFPRLHHPRMAGYSGTEYLEIAKRIGRDKIEVYETRRNPGMGGEAKYKSYGALNFFVVTPTLTDFPKDYTPTIVHEATHAIQDKNKWRMSSLDNEVDAHFAEALYFLRSGREWELKNDKVMEDFLTAAREYDRDPDYLKSLKFHKLRRDMRSAISAHYAKMAVIFGNGNFDEKELKRDFRRKNRWNGVPD